VTIRLNGIDDYDKLEDRNYSAWQEFILHHGSDVEVESDAWLEGTLLLSMEPTLLAEVESDLKSLPANQQGALTMLHFIIKRMVICNQEAWDSLEEYIKMFDICNFPGENVSTACLKLKAVVTVLGDKLPSNAVRILLEGFSQASTKSFSSVCESKIAMRSDSIYALLLKSVPLCNQVTFMLDDLEQKYQQLITGKKWDGIGHVGMNSTNKSCFNAMANQDDEEQGYAAYVKKTKSCKFLAFEEWAKLQKCNYCGNQGHICPQYKKYLADKENGTPPPPVDKRNNKPFFNKDNCCEKFNKDPKLKALLFAFAAFTNDYISESQPKPDKKEDDDQQVNSDSNKVNNDDDVNAFLGMFGALKE
jgi:hypothetical protein